jgi:hypothetical protein
MPENDEDVTKKKTVNAREIEPKRSPSQEIQPPDVCKTPSASGPIPIPYPNIAKSSDTSKGAKKVKVDGKEVMTKEGDYEKSTGDEAGTDETRSWSAVEPTKTKSLTDVVKENPLVIAIIVVIVALIVVVYFLNSQPKIIPADEPRECIRKYLAQTMNM